MTYNKEDVKGFLKRRNVTLYSEAEKPPSWQAALSTWAKTAGNVARSCLTHPTLTLPMPFLGGVIAFFVSPIGPLVGLPIVGFVAIFIAALGLGLAFLSGSYSALEAGHHKPHAIFTALATFMFMIAVGIPGTADSTAHFLALHGSGLQAYEQAFEASEQPYPRSGGELIERGALSNRYCPGVVRKKSGQGGSSAETLGQTTCVNAEGKPTELKLTDNERHEVTVRYDDALDQPILQITNLQHEQALMVARNYDWQFYTYSSADKAALFYHSELNKTTKN